MPIGPPGSRKKYFKVPVFAQSSGGVLVSHSDIDAAFRFLDSSGKGKLTIGGLRHKLAAFFPDMPISELNFLLGDKKEMTAEELHALLDTNQITNFDPVAEAFKCFDVRVVCGGVDQMLVLRCLSGA